MNITKVRVTRLESEGKIKAMVSITIDECFAVTGLKIMDGIKGLFVAMPSRKLPDGTYKDICFPTDKDTREAIQEAVLAKYIELKDEGNISTDICPDCKKPVDQCDCVPF